MVKVRCLTGIAGNRFSFRRGSIASFSEAEAANLVAAGYAEYFGEVPTPKAKPAGAPPAGGTPGAGPAVDEFAAAGIPKKLADFLRAGGLTSLAAVESRADQELIDLKGLGQKSVSDIRKAIAKFRAAQ